MMTLACATEIWILSVERVCACVWFVVVLMDTKVLRTNCQNTFVIASVLTVYCSSHATVIYVTCWVDLSGMRLLEHKAKESRGTKHVKTALRRGIHFTHGLAGRLDRNRGHWCFTP